MKKKVIIPVIASIITVLILSGVSYAYYSAKIKENNKTETILKSNELNLIFTGTKEITANNMIIKMYNPKIKKSFLVIRTTFFHSFTKTP